MPSLKTANITVTQRREESQNWPITISKIGPVRNSSFAINCWKQRRNIRIIKVGSMSHGRALVVYTRLATTWGTPTSLLFFLTILSTFLTSAWQVSTILWALPPKCRRNWFFQSNRRYALPVWKILQILISALLACVYPTVPRRVKFPTGNPAVIKRFVKP